jgi:hypothetical protein
MSSPTPVTRTSSPTITPYDGVPYGLKVHAPYHIAWAASDRSTMSPQPPDFTCASQLATWIPGQPDGCTFSKWQYDHEDGLPGIEYVYGFLMIGLPLIFTAIVSCCLCCCFGRGKQPRGDPRPHRERVLAARAREAAQGARTRAGVEALQANSASEQQRSGMATGLNGVPLDTEIALESYPGARAAIQAKNEAHSLVGSSSAASTACVGEQGTTAHPTVNDTGRMV